MSSTRFTEDHEWARKDADDVVTVGITEYAQGQLGDLVHIELPAEDDEFTQGDEAAVVESVKAASEVKSPVSGAIVEVNTTLADEPGIVNQDANGGGWLYKIRMSDPTEFDGLLDEQAYQTLLDKSS